MPNKNGELTDEELNEVVRKHYGKDEGVEDVDREIAQAAVKAYITSQASKTDEEMVERIAKQLRQWHVDNWYGCPQKNSAGEPSVETGWGAEPKHVKQEFIGKAKVLLSLLTPICAAQKEQARNEIMDAIAVKIEVRDKLIEQAVAEAVKKERTEIGKWFESIFDPVARGFYSKELKLLKQGKSVLQSLQ